MSAHSGARARSLLAGRNRYGEDWQQQMNMEQEPAAVTNDQLREVFDMVDVDKGGTLDKDEVGRPDMRCLHPCICVSTAAIPHHHLDQYQCAAEVEGDPDDGLYIGGDGAQLLQQWEAGDGTRGSGRDAYHGCRRQWRGTGACTINRPCAQKYVVKSQSCMVTSGRLIVRAPVGGL